MRPSVAQTLTRTIELSSGFVGGAEHALLDEPVEPAQRGRVARDDRRGSSPAR